MALHVLLRLGFELCWSATPLLIIGAASWLMFALVYFYFSAVLVNGHLAALELALGPRVIARPWWTLLVAAVLLSVFAFLAFAWYFLPWSIPFGFELGQLLYFSIVLLVQVWVALCMRAFSLARGLAAEAAKGALGCRRESAAAARRAVGDQMVALLLASLSLTLRLVHFADFFKIVSWSSLAMLDGNVTAVDGLGNCLAALWLAGAFRGGLRVAEDEAHRCEARARAWLEAAEAWTPHEDPRWQAKVVELGERGVTLAALLDFYDGLGVEYMRSWDARRNTTADVVRQAIIPLSSEAKSALSTVMMGGVPTRPQKMVTHHWGNRFTDLMAAIIADALGEDEYGPVRRLLLVDKALLRQWLAEAGKLDASYWVCAFCVNQHQTICASNPRGTKDTVTGEVYPLCACGLAKSWNLSPPVTSSGRSVSCEVNKFDAMMRNLSAANPDFEQVVAIDGDFNLFTRAWCLAELAAANTMGMRQRLKLRWAEDLEPREAQLRELRMEDMQASRAEDKQEIMAGIPDVTAFDAALQRLIFKDLLPAWRSLDAEQQMRRVARLARWQQLGSDRGPKSPASAQGTSAGRVLFKRDGGSGVAEEEKTKEADAAEKAKEADAAEKAKEMEQGCSWWAGEVDEEGLVSPRLLSL